MADNTAIRLRDRLSTRLLALLFLALVGSSLAFLILFVGLYRRELARERGHTSVQISRLLQLALENAMLKRDLPGLRKIILRLNRQPGIERVMIANPQRIVRFASRERDLGTTLTPQSLGCADCTDELNGQAAISRFIMTQSGQSILRSVNPIRNKSACKTCHGPVEKSPINGILVVDHDASAITSRAFRGSTLLAAVGLTIVVLALTATWLFLRTFFLRPVEEISAASQALAAGQLDRRVKYSSRRRDELSVLSESFNEMAAELSSKIQSVTTAEAFLQSLINSIPDGIRVIDQNYRVVRVNRAYCEMVGADQASLIGEPCYHIHGREEPCPATLITCPFHAIDDDGSTIKYIHRHVGMNGREHYVETTAGRLLVETNGKPERLIVEAMRDLTEQARFSQEQRMAELGQLAAGVAHEIYNPLASVKLGLQALLRNRGGTADINEQSADYIRIVDAEVDKCIEITKRLLSLSMPPSREVQLVSMSEVITDVLSLLRYEAEAGNIAVNTTLVDSELRIVSRDSEMRMLILNLVQNAFHAMPEGGTLSVSGSECDGHVRIDVADTGVGISADKVHRIFDPFYSDRGDRLQGTGLGLTICRAIVRRYHGDIEVQSEVGKGTAFKVTLPAAFEA